MASEHCTIRQTALPSLSDHKVIRERFSVKRGCEREGFILARKDEIFKYNLYLGYNNHYRGYYVATKTATN